MRIPWLKLATLILLGAASGASRQQLHIEADFDPSKFIITGKAEARLVTDGAPFEDLRFLLYPNSMGDSVTDCGIVVDSMRVNGVDVTPHMTVDGSDLHVTLPPDLSPTDTASAVLWFRSSIPKRASVYGFDDDQFLLVMWYPTPAPLRDGRWLELRYPYWLEPASDPLDLTATVRFPDSLQLIAGGVVRSDTADGLCTARLALDRSVGLPLFFGTGYESHHFAEEGYDLEIYARPKQGYVVDSLRRAVVNAVRWMGDYVLPYPYHELIVVVGGYTEGGALEEPHMVLMPLHSPGITKYYQETLIHEVVHQWFYATVCNNTATDPWMDEAVTEYFAEKINHDLVGGPDDLVTALGLSASTWLEERAAGYDYLPYLPLTYSGEKYYNTRQCYGTIYAKGPQVLRTLTALMGPNNERAFWQDYVRSFEHEVPDQDNFMNTADKYLPYPPGTARRIMDCAQSLDFQILSLKNESGESPAESASGTDSVNGADSTLVSDTTDTAAERTSYSVGVAYRCVQTLGLPVILRVRFYDGSVVDTTVSGEVGTFEWKLKGTTPARSAAIDPDGCYAIDVNYLNNSLTLDEGRGVGLRLFSGLAFFVESLFTMLWGF